MARTRICDGVRRHRILFQQQRAQQSPSEKLFLKYGGKFDGLAIRVPTSVVSLTDFTFVLSRDVTAEEVNAVLEAASKTDRFKGILEVTNEPLVSSDFIGSPASSTVDLSLTKVVGGNLVKVVAWYDNEWGYSERLVDMALMV